MEEELDTFIEDVVALGRERGLPIAAVIILSVGPDGHLVSNVMERCGTVTLQGALLELAADPGEVYAGEVTK